MSAAILPAQTYSSKDKSRAAAFARDLAARGLTYQREYVPGSKVPPNHFRTTFRPATRTRPATYKVRFNDQTPGPRVQRPLKPKVAKARGLPPLCENAKVGCPRPRVYLDGYCKRCHDRREYWSNPEIRAKRVEQAIRHGREKRAERRKMREAA